LVDLGVDEKFIKAMCGGKVESGEFFVEVKYPVKRGESAESPELYRALT
jgi:hypothetical protein